MDGDDADPDAFATTDVGTPTPAGVHRDDHGDERETHDGFARSETLPDPTELIPGSKIGRYKLINRIGGGAMGVVWRARDPKLDRDVAIKVVHPSLARIPDAAGRLLREARALAKVSHSAVVAVHDAGQEDERLFIAMELVEGTTLGTILRDRPRVDLREWRRMLPLMIEAGRGLAAAHGAGVLHRDFKPDNVLVSQEGRVCVADFGLAEIAASVVSSTPRRPSTLDPADSWLLGSVDTLTRTGAVVGTPAYMSPEQMRGGSVDARSDQFSFCVATYEALYGHRPFDYKPGPDQPPAVALLMEIEAGKIKPAPRDSSVPRWVRDVIVRGLAAVPGERWSDMRELLAALRPPKRTGWWVLAAAIVVAAVITFAVATRSSERPAPVLRQLFPMPMSQRIESSADGRWIAYADDDRVYVRDLVPDSPQLPREHPMGGSVDRIEFERGDILVAAVLLPDRFALRRWYIPSGVTEDAGDLTGWNQWFGSVVGGQVVARSVSGSYEMAVDYGTAVEVFATPRRRVTVAAIAPGKQRFAYVEEDGFQGRIVVQDFARKLTLRSEVLVELTGVTWIDDNRLLYSTGMSERPTMWKATVSASGIGAGTAVWGKEQGWFGYLSVVGDRIHFVDSATSFAVRWVDRDQPGSSRELDPASIAAGLGWDDAGRPLGWQRTSGHVVTIAVEGTRIEVTPSPPMLDGDVGNATRAGDVLIVSLRRRGAREVIARSLADGHRMWSRAPGDGLLVRCAGDKQAPCFLVRTDPAGAALINAIDPNTGELGAVLPAPPTVTDIAVATDGSELIISDGTSWLHRIALADPVPVLARHIMTELATIRGVVHDPRGGLLVTGTRKGQLYQLIQITPDGDDPDAEHDETVVAQSSNDLLSVPRPSPTGDRILVLTRRYLPVIFELRGAL